MRDLRTLPESYKLYLRKAEEMGCVPVSRQVYMRVVRKLVAYLMNKVLDGYDVKLGANMGVIGVRGMKTKPAMNTNGKARGISPTWHKTRLVWAEKAKEMGISLKEYIATVPQEERQKYVVYCFNEHSGGIRYRLIWHKVNATVRNKKYYSMIFNRPYKREMWRRIMDGQEYVVVLEKEEGSRRRSWKNKSEVERMVSDERVRVTKHGEIEERREEERRKLVNTDNQ